MDFFDCDFNITKIILACHIGTGMGSVVHENRPSHGLAINCSGEKTYCFSKGKDLVVKENEIILLPKHSTYRVKSKIKGPCYAINFDIDEDFSFEPFVLNMSKSTDVIKSFRSATNAWETKKPGYAAKCKSELYSIIYSLINTHSASYFPKDKLDMIRPAVDYIHEKYFSEQISIKKLSSMCGITPEYFRKIFKSFMGASPISYINRLKITRAMELICSKMYSVSVAANLSGYTEMSHFSREFKKVTGMSPSCYKKGMKANI